MINVLPTTVPPIVLYLYHAYPLSIVFNNQASHASWFFENYVQTTCYYDKQHEDFAWFDFLVDRENPRFPGVNYEVRSRDDLIRNADVINYLIELIDHNKYIYTFVDKFYIPGQ